MNSTLRTVLCIITVVGAVLASFFPYFFEELFHYKGSIIIEVIGGPILYIIFVALAFWISGMSNKCWWLLITSPICFGPLILTVYAFISWKLKGFAP